MLLFSSKKAITTIIAIKIVIIATLATDAIVKRLVGALHPPARRLRLPTPADRRAAQT